MLVSGDELVCKIKPIKANVCGVMDLLASSFYSLIFNYTLFALCYFATYFCIAFWEFSLFLTILIDLFDIH